MLAKTEMSGQEWLHHSLFGIQQDDAEVAPRFTFELAELCPPLHGLE